MKLMIRSQPAILAWETKNAQQTTPSMPKEPLNLEIEEPQMEMETTKSVIHIDQDQCFNESGLKNNSAFLEDMVARSKQAVMEGIAHRVEEGNQMMAIETGQDAIAEQASYNAWERFYHEFGLVTMPMSRPIITVEEGDVSYNFKRGSVRVLNGPFQIDRGTYEPGKVEYYMKQKNSITITPVGDEVDITL
ncbi:MAG: hypothetical protein JXO44_15125 [Clostridia bacterium]|nr:hypothetical protein [Clostridia bacterium]